MRVGIIALLHESNTFIDQPTTMESFEGLDLLEGEAIRAGFADAHHEVGGFFAGLEEAGVDAVPIFAARALPSGAIRADCWSELLRRLFERADASPSLDGVLVAPHGATVSEEHPDADGYWLSVLRARVGADLPIIGTIDPHANLSRLMVQSCDALTAYRTNPHLDQRARGHEAATLMVRAVRGEIRPTMHAEFPPLAINIERQMTDEPHLRPLYELADEQLRHERALTNSIVLGFPYADVNEMGSSVIAVSNEDELLARTMAGDLATCLWRRREDFVGQMIGIDEALARCERLEGPVCLLDMGDNVGGGSSADGTWLAQSIHERGIERSFVCLYDPETVRRVEQVGSGRTAELSVGGKTDDQHGSPISAPFRVVSLHEGRFSEAEVRHGAFSDFDQGRTAIIESRDGLTIMVTSKRMVPFSLQQLRSCGLDPSGFRVLVAKGVIAPIAAYREVCPNLIRVNTPGSTCADMTRLEFRNRRRPMFPFEIESQWPSSCDYETSAGAHFA